MNELAIKLAELLEISVEAAIKLYPEIRSQYIVYKSLNGIDIFAKTIFVITLIAFILMSVEYVLEGSRRSSKEGDEQKKLLKVLLLTLLISMIINIGVNALTAIFATDLRMLLEFM